MNFIDPRSQLYLKSHPLVATIGLAAFLTGLLFLLYPEFALSASSLGQFLPDGYEIVWPTLHCLGGGLICYGMVRGKPNFEAAGLTLLFFTLTCSWVGVIAIRGLESGVVASSTIGAVATGGLIRAIMLVRSGQLR